MTGLNGSNGGAHDRAPRIVVTGASGFLGRAVVAAALRHQFEVIAISRSGFDDPADGVASVAMDLGKDESALATHTSGAVAVIHAAATMSGDDAAHEKDTIAPTRAVIAACSGPNSPRLVLVSSFSVYGYAAMPEGATLDELTPLEPDPEKRDAYCRAKLTQERLVMEAVQKDGLEARVVRPGAIYGPGRTWPVHLGFAKGKRVLTVGGTAPVPAIYVDHCAEILVRAATADLVQNDIPIPSGDGEFEVFNAVDPDPPTQTEWIETLMDHGDTPIRKIIRLPYNALQKITKGFGFLSDRTPALSGIWRRMPSVARKESFAARFKPLRYDTSRVEERLGYRPDRSFEAAMIASLKTKDDG